MAVAPGQEHLALAEAALWACRIQTCPRSGARGGKEVADDEEKARGREKGVGASAMGEVTAGGGRGRGRGTDRWGTRAGQSLFLLEEADDVGQ